MSEHASRGPAAVWVLAAAVLAAALVSVVPADAQQTASARLSLASQTPWMRNGAFTIRLDVDRVTRPQELAMVVTVHRAVTSRSQFLRTIDGDLLGASVHRDRIPFADLRFDAGGAVPITIALPELRGGVYPVHVQLVDGRDEVDSLVSHIVRTPGAPAEVPLSVAWVQPYGAPPAMRADGTLELAEDALDPLRTIAAQLDAGAPLTVLPNPETIAGLAAVAGAPTVDALARLLGEHQVVATPFVEVDVSALVAAGRVADLLRQRDEGDRVLSDVLGIDADARTWSLRGPVTRGALRELDQLGIRRVILDEAALVQLPSSATGGLTLSRPFLVGGAERSRLEAAVADPGLASHFEEDDDVLAAHHLLADLSVLHLDAPGTRRGVVVRPPEDWAPSEAMLSTVIGNLASSPLLEPVTLNDYFADVEPLTDAEGEPFVRALNDGDAAPLTVPSSLLERARDTMTGFAALAGESNAELGMFDRLLLVAESRRLGRAASRAYVDAVIDRIAAASANVRVLGDRTFRLTAREGTIPLTFVNDNPFDVTVSVRLSSDKLEFTGDNLDRLALEANGTTTEAVPVKALTSGAFPLRVTVSSTDGRIELGRSRFTVTSTVASGVGIVLSVGAAGFLLLWWASHWRTVRRARRLVPAE